MELLHVLILMKKNLKENDDEIDNAKLKINFKKSES